MSRLSSNSPEILNLPRRSVLKSLAAAPTAVVAAKGEAFSAQSSAVSCEQDERYRKADRLMQEVNASYDAFLASREGQLNEEGEDTYELAADRWDEARDALRGYAAELAEKPTRDLTDALVLARIADFHLVDELHENENLEDSVPQALRAVLKAHGIAPTDKTAAAIESARFEAEIANKPPQPQHVPLSVNAGDIIARLRALGEAYKGALKLEAALEEETPQMEAAVAVTNRHHAELVTIGDEILRARPLSENSPYDFTQRDDFVVWIELMAAFQDELFHGAIGDTRCTRILQAMLARARETGDELVEQANRWHASRGEATNA